ncbi:MAG TPA: hypothetical protein VGC21_10250 [Telluria sp.]|jgi:hypothetical protein
MNRPTPTYAAWRAGFQCPEQAAEAAYQMVALLTAKLAKADRTQAAGRKPYQRRMETPQ